MKRTYAARRLLEHGPLTLSEVVAITRWPYRAAQVALRDLVVAGTVRTTPVQGRKHHARRYELTEWIAPAPLSVDSCAFVRERNNCAASNVRAQQPRWTA